MRNADNNVQVVSDLTANDYRHSHIVCYIGLSVWTSQIDKGF